MANSYQKLHWVLLLGALLFGAYLRFANLGVPSFWVDELDFVEAAKSQADVGEPLLPSGYAYPRAPLLTRSLVVSFNFFGVTEFSSRLPSAVFGFLMIPLIYFVSRRWFDERTALLAAIMISFAPFEVGWSRACRMYALFQLTFLAGMYFFYHGFEKGGWPGTGVADRQGSPGLKRLLADWNIHVPSLLLAGIFFVMSYTTHQNTALFLVCLFAYVLVMAGRIVFKAGFAASVKSKYGVFLLCFLGLALLFGFIPQVRDFAQYAIGYQPGWAEVGSAQNQWRIFEFIFGDAHFPINILFCVGALLILGRWHKPGVFALVTLFVPVLLFSFVFQYRKSDYVFNVYPVVFIVASFALSRISEFFERALLSPKLKNLGNGLQHLDARKRVALLLCLLWLPLTPGFRFGQKIPRLKDGYFNGAIYHNEWRAAAKFMQHRLAETDVLMSTLPLSVQHYLGRAEYNLNWSNADLAITNNIVAADGRFIDLYSGTDIIDDLTELKTVLQENPSGWLLVDNYRFSNQVYVPGEVHDFLVSNLPRVFESDRKTVSVFKWSQKEVTNAVN